MNDDVASAFFKLETAKGCYVMRGSYRSESVSPQRENVSGNAFTS